MLSKLFIYYCLVEKIYITRKLNESRVQSKLYCFNLFVILVPYCVAIALNVIHRISYFTPNGMCIIGVKSQPLIVFIVLDAALNLYLTLLFAIPLRAICRHSQARNPLLRTICLRSLLNCVLTLVASLTNLTILLALHGEPAWIFLLCCNIDVVFSTLIRGWVTLNGPPSTKTSHPPEDAVVNESNVATPSFSSSQTTQNIHTETIRRDLAIDQNGKITETKAQRANSAVEEKHIKCELSLARLEFFRTVPTPPNSPSLDEICFPSAALSGDEVEDDDEEQKDSETKSLGRAIITTHISAQKMHDSEHHPGDFFYNVDAEGMVKLGGIRVMIEQVFEVEYESYNRS